jgi:hypothetical protein
MGMTARVSAEMIGKSDLAATGCQCEIQGDQQLEEALHMQWLGNGRRADEWRFECSVARF